jgi:hypothetical protein
MIDICMVVFANYGVVEMNVEAFNSFHGKYRLFLCDNSLPELYRDDERFKNLKKMNPNVILIDIEPFDRQNPAQDGNSHGYAMDILVKHTDSEIVGTMDSDFFWLRRDILDLVGELYSDGYEAIGASPVYDDWKFIESQNPSHASDIAPYIWGQFLKREIALADTFVVTQEEGGQLMETGWRVRQYIANNNIKKVIWDVVDFEYRAIDSNVSYYGANGKAIGMHILKSSSSRFIQASDKQYIASAYNFGVWKSK